MRRKVEVPDNNIITPDVVIPDSGDLAPQAPTKAEINYSFDFNIGDTRLKERIKELEAENAALREIVNEYQKKWP